MVDLLAAEDFPTGVMAAGQQCIGRRAVSVARSVSFHLDRRGTGLFFVTLALENKATAAVASPMFFAPGKGARGPALKINKCLTRFAENAVPNAACRSGRRRESRYFAITVSAREQARGRGRRTTRINSKC